MCLNCWEEGNVLCGEFIDVYDEGGWLVEDRAVSGSRGRSNNFELQDAPTVNGTWKTHFPPLNEFQKQALARNASIGDCLSNKINIIEGPPGTRKRRVVAITALDCPIYNKKFIMLAETRYAVGVAADAIFEAMITTGMHERRVFVIEHSPIEGIQKEIESVDGDEDEDKDEDRLGAPRGPQMNAAVRGAPMSEKIRTKVYTNCINA